MLPMDADFDDAASVATVVGCDARAAPDAAGLLPPPAAAPPPGDPAVAEAVLCAELESMTGALRALAAEEERLHALTRDLFANPLADVDALPPPPAAALVDEYDPPAGEAASDVATPRLATLLCDFKSASLRGVAYDDSAVVGGPPVDELVAALRGCAGVRVAYDVPRGPGAAGLRVFFFGGTRAARRRAPPAYRKPTPRREPERAPPAPTSLAEALASDHWTLLEKWTFEHADKPYPSPETKDSLARDSRLSLKQVQHWFSNMRKRKYLKLGTGAGKRAPKDAFEAQLLALMPAALAAAAAPVVAPRASSEPAAAAAAAAAPPAGAPVPPPPDDDEATIADDADLRDVSFEL